MKYIVRKSESNNSQLPSEFLQGGLILRFNENLVIKDNTTNSGTTEINYYQCDEVLIEESFTIDELKIALNNNHFSLTKSQLEWLMNNMAKDV